VLAAWPRATAHYWLRPAVRPPLPKDPLVNR